MDEHDLYTEDTLKLIREVEKDPSLNQRLLSQKLDISLGKTNYLLRELVKKGMIKIASFSKNPGKASKLKYILTQKGLEGQIRLTIHFLEAKEKEYKRLKEEYQRVANGRGKINKNGKQPI